MVIGKILTFSHHFLLMAAKALQRLTKEIDLLNKKPVQGFTLNIPDPSNIFNLEFVMEGPAGTPYEGGKFKIAFVFPEDYPFKAPNVAFQTKIYHPNVDQNDGVACLPIIHPNWKPATKISQVLESIIDMVKNPNPDHAVDAEIGQQFVTKRAEFDSMARQTTQQYAI